MASLLLPAGSPRTATLAYDGCAVAAPFHLILITFRREQDVVDGDDWVLSSAAVLSVLQFSLSYFVGGRGKWGGGRSGDADGGVGMGSG